MKSPKPKVEPDVQRTRDELADCMAQMLAELRAFYPHLTSCALVLTPGPYLPAVVIPVTVGNVPNVIRGEWEDWRTHS